MSGGINLHAITRAIIPSIHPDETVLIYHSLGQKNVKGEIAPCYYGPLETSAQVQAESDAALFHSNNVGQNSHVIRAYLYVDDDLPPVAGIDRKNMRNGDLIQRGDDSWWLVTAVIDQFADVGWVCVRAVRQTKAPDGIEAAI